MKAFFHQFYIRKKLNSYYMVMHIFPSLKAPPLYFMKVKVAEIFPFEVGSNPTLGTKFFVRLFSTQMIFFNR